jgi:hypothetical protein
VWRVYPSSCPLYIKAKNYFKAVFAIVLFMFVCVLVKFFPLISSCLVRVNEIENSNSFMIGLSEPYINILFHGLNEFSKFRTKILLVGRWAGIILEMSQEINTIKVP